jgi:NAD(P)-dependent dehydrogenase (short-subunit alcohol dehydrogenase family)
MEQMAQTVVPLGRAGSAAEVAQVALWLASEAASYVHGTVIDVAGGR